MKKEELKAAGAAAFGDNWRTELARQLNVNPRTVRFWDSGERPIPENIKKEMISLLNERIALISEQVKLLGND